MDEYKIVGWTDYDSEYPTKRVNEDNLRKVLFAVRKEIMDNKYYFSGEDHQNSLTGVPVFEDGTCFRSSMRCWAQIMASIYTDSEGNQRSYMDFYMFMDEESRLPEYEELDVLPKALNDAIDEEAKNKGVQYVTNERADFSIAELDFDKIKNRFEEILTDLIKNNSETDFQTIWAPKITQITEKYLGRGKKASQCTRDQVEQLNLVVLDLEDLIK